MPIFDLKIYNFYTMSVYNLDTFLRQKTYLQIYKNFSK